MQNLVAKSIADQLEKRVSFKKAMKRAATIVIKLEQKELKLVVQGVWVEQKLLGMNGRVLVLFRCIR